jgi:DNA-directed RNA polymerase III subunit RPC3
VLATYGRLEAIQLAQRCRLPLRQIRHGLSVLVQAQLVYHHTSSDQRTSYEANLRAAYDLIRSGKIIHLAKQGLGEDAALVVAHILLVGQVTIKDLDRFWKQSHGDSKIQNGEGNQGHRKTHNDVTESAEAQAPLHSRSHQGRNDLSNILKRLVQNGFLLRIRRAHFCTPADNYFDAQSQLLPLEDGTAAKGRKSQDEPTKGIMEEMASRNDASISLADVIDGTSTGFKRPAADVSASAARKKTKLTNGASCGLHGPASNTFTGDVPAAVSAMQLSSLPRLTLLRKLLQFASTTTRSPLCFAIAA